VTIALNVFLNLLLLSALLAFVASVAWITFWSTDIPIERVMRAFAFFGGALVVLGAQATGHGFAQYAVNAFSGVRPAGGGVQFIATVIPGGVGVAMAWYLIRSWKKNEVIGFRILAFVGMLSATSFVVVYAQAFHVKGVALGAAILPNVSFLVGIIIYMMLKFDPSSLPVSNDGKIAKGARTLRDAVIERQKKKAS
jgi:hypothetical protein